MSIAIATAVIEAVKGIIGRVIPDKAAAEQAAAAVEQLHAKGELDVVLSQLQINLQEARSPNWFVAGWRPFIGWVCGVGLVCHFTGAHVFDEGTRSLMIQILGGLAGLRTIEKATGAEGRR